MYIYILEGGEVKFSTDEPTYVDTVAVEDGTLLILKVTKSVPLIMNEAGGWEALEEARLDSTEGAAWHA